MEEMICEKCGYKWYKRVDSPKKCPDCTRKLKKAIKEEEVTNDLR